ncbi:MAG: 8-amino-7-oxononanoate synthase [Alkalimonas sp.]|nr:8-amino-7-oxononanoate synthase [Alkalimonas sp.]
MQLARLQQALKERQQQQLWRQMVCIEPLAEGRLRANGQVFLNFSGNDYLGLAAEPKVLQAAAEGLHRFGFGSTGSPLVTGHHYAHQALSDALCDWLGFEQVLLFSSGFAANQAMLQTLADSKDTLLLDKLSHASLIDAVQQRAGPFKRFLHNDLLSLKTMLERLPHGEAMVATEGVFSMDGDSPDLLAMNQLCQQAQAPLLLDDAHGLGVYGQHGEGSWHQQGVKPEQLHALMANFGKALGGSGAFIAASATVIDYLRQFGRHYIYSTALSPAVCWGLLASVHCCQADQWRRDKLQHNIALFRRLAAEFDLPVMPSASAIQPLLVGDTAKALQLSQQLKKRGIWLTAIRPPTVPVNKSRLRIALSSSHQPDAISQLVQTIKELF